MEALRRIAPVVSPLNHKPRSEMPGLDAREPLSWMQKGSYHNASSAEGEFPD